MGIDKYNAECRSIVMRYASEWKDYVERMGRWVDFDNDYKTLDPNFMESIWWVFKTLWDKGLIYRADRVMPYSTALATPLAKLELSAETAKEVTDIAITVALKVVDEADVYLLIWTTMAWTMVSNLAVCVNPTMKYVKLHDHKSSRVYIIAENLVRNLYKGNPEGDEEAFTILDTFDGSQLIGLKYTPAYNFFYEKVNIISSGL